MKAKIVVSLFFIILPPLTNASNLRGDNSHWTCASFDHSGKQWLAKSSFQRVALNKAFRQCKQQSHEPSSCEVASEYCEASIQGYKPPKWQCSAFDKLGKVWPSDLHRHRDDAAVGAKTLCKQQSVFPASCYVRLMTCKSKQ